LDPLTLASAAEATRARLVARDPGALLARVSTDSRDIRQGDLFVCLEGPRHDAHAYAADALAAGAAAVMTHRELPDLQPQLVVHDTRDALGALGAHVRRHTVALDGNEPLVVAITGTNGKTSTKDLTAAALGCSMRTVSSRRSFNNEIGVPLTLLEMDRGTEAAVVEVGTNAPGEIGRLAALARPAIAIITNVQSGHLAGLGSLEGVLAEKGSLLDGLTGRAVSILNADDPSFGALRERAPGPVISYGLAADADVRATEVACDGAGTSFVVGGRHPVRLGLLGRHTVSNALASLACACVAGVRVDQAIEAISAVPPPPGRLALRHVGDLTIIDDTYNANPGSFAAALETVGELSLPGRLLIVAGDMLELGDASEALHREAGRRLAAAEPAYVLAVGEHGDALLAGAREAGLPASACRRCEGQADVIDRLTADRRSGDIVLVKGSRGAQLDRLVDRLLDDTVSVA
jgi:UDP-N-acetylmuramoyl-tripeptide--D-alanyl-D-alanine ligase